MRVCFLSGVNSGSYFGVGISASSSSSSKKSSSSSNSGRQSNQFCTPRGGLLIVPLTLSKSLVSLRDDRGVLICDSLLSPGLLFESLLFASQLVGCGVADCCEEI